MKKLILVRHAKSDWPENMRDFDRPLAERGFQDAKAMSTFLKEKNIDIQQFVSSPAVRALQTCEIFNEIFQLDFTTNEKLYHPSENNFLSVIFDLNDEVNSVAMFSHNNGISNFANYISEQTIHFPTCGVAGFEADCSSWSEFENARKKLIFYYEPKGI